MEAAAEDVVKIGEHAPACSKYLPLNQPGQCRRMSSIFNFEVFLDCKNLHKKSKPTTAISLCTNQNSPHAIYALYFLDS